MQISGESVQQVNTGRHGWGLMKDTAIPNLTGKEIVINVSASVKEHADPDKTHRNTQQTSRGHKTI